MKIYRYPQSNSRLRELTDKKIAGIDYHITSMNQVISFNITKDKNPEKSSMIDVEITEEDIQYLNGRMFDIYKNRICELERTIELLYQEKRVHADTWSVLYNKLDEIFISGSLNLYKNKDLLILSILKLSDQMKSELFDESLPFIDELKSSAEKVKEE